MAPLIVAFDDSPEDALDGDPAVGVPVVVADLILVAANSRDHVCKITVLDLAEHHVTHSDIFRTPHGRVGTLLPMADTRGHRVAPLAKANCLAGTQASDPGIAPQEACWAWVRGMLSRFLLHEL